jgi:hypothetical protein
MRKVAKSVVMSLSEVKRHVTASGTLVCADNVSRLAIPNCLSITQDASRDGGLGQQVLASGVNVKLQVRATTGHAPYWKWFVIESNPSNITTSASIFENLTGNAMLDNIKKEFRVLKSGMIIPINRSEYSGQLHHQPWLFRNIWVPLKKKITYKSDAMTTSINKSVCVYVVAYENGVPTTIDVGTASVYSTFYYRDF